MEIYEASRSRDYNKVRHIVSTNRESVKIVAEDDKTPLYIAIEQKDFDLVQIFLNCGANPNAKTKLKHWTAMHCAAFYNDQNIINILFTFGGELEELSIDTMTPLILASSLGNFEAMKALLSLGANVNASQSNMIGETALYYAIKQNNLKHVQFLLDYGANPNLMFGNIGTAVHLACIEGKEDILRVLLEFGGDIKTANKRNQLPINVTENPKIKKILIDKKAQQHRVPSMIAPASFQFDDFEQENLENNSEDIKEIMNIEKQLFREVNNYVEQRKKSVRLSKSIIPRANVNTWIEPKRRNEKAKNEADTLSRNQFASNFFGAKISIGAHPMTDSDELVDFNDSRDESSPQVQNDSEIQLRDNAIQRLKDKNSKEAMRRRQSQRVMSTCQSIALSLIHDNSTADLLNDSFDELMDDVEQNKVKFSDDIENDNEAENEDEQMQNYFGTDDIVAYPGADKVVQATEMLWSWISRIAGVVIDEQAQRSLEHTLRLLNSLFHDRDQSKSLDALLALSLLALFYDSQIYRSHILEDSEEEVEDAIYYFGFACAAYGWKMLNPLMFANKRKAVLIKGFAMGDIMNNKALCEHTGINEEDIITTKWTSSDYQPAHFIALDHSRKSIIVAIRGSFHVKDALIDLIASACPFKYGFAHTGMLECAKRKLDMIRPDITKLIQQYPDYNMRVVGHSLGAGTASLLTILINDEFPSLSIHCFAYATPCVLSPNLALEYSKIITSYVLGNDCVPRLSFGSIHFLKKLTAKIMTLSKSNVKLFFLMSRGKVDVEKLKQEIFTSIESRLLPPGKVYQIIKDPEFNDNNSSFFGANQPTIYRMERSNPTFFGEVIVCSSMFADHLPWNYNEALYGVKLALAMKKNPSLFQSSNNNQSSNFDAISRKLTTFKKNIFSRNNQKMTTKKISNMELASDLHLANQPNQRRVHQNNNKTTSPDQPLLLDHPLTHENQVTEEESVVSSLIIRSDVELKGKSRSPMGQKPKVNTTIVTPTMSFAPVFQGPSFSSPHLTYHPNNVHSSTKPSVAAQLKRNHSKTAAPNELFYTPPLPENLNSKPLPPIPPARQNTNNANNTTTNNSSPPPPIKSTSNPSFQPSSNLITRITESENINLVHSSPAVFLEPNQPTPPLDHTADQTADQSTDQADDQTDDQKNGDTGETQQPNDVNNTNNDEREVKTKSQFMRHLNTTLHAPPKSSWIRPDTMIRTTTVTSNPTENNNGVERSPPVARVPTTDRSNKTRPYVPPKFGSANSAPIIRKNTIG